MHKFCRIILLLSLLCAAWVPVALARLDGAAEWGYAHFEQSSDSDNDLSASHFTQRYSLLYSTQGLLAGGRAGYYDLGLGAEWGAFESDFDGAEVSRDALKYLYEGHLRIAPGALPFRLDAYSYDLQKIQFTKTAGSRFLDTATPYHLIQPDIVTDLNNGQTIVSGIQLQAGIRNGAYLGKHRQVLSQWPRLLIDYRDVYHRDLKAEYQQHYRLRNLAFVSLNKKDNWFHYRVNTFRDYLRPENDYDEHKIILGTVDHTLKRQWINLTNWIRISVDGSYTESNRSWEPWQTERFDVNLFTTMYRRDFSASSFANMQRIKRGANLEHTLDVPVYLYQHLDANTSVRSTLQFWRQDETRSDIEGDRGEEALYGRVLFETHKRERVQINPSLEMEVHTGDKGEGEAIRGKVEAYSNRLLRQPLAWYGMGSLAVFNGTSENDADTNLWESELQGGVTYRLSRSLQLGAEQRLLYGEGSHGTQATHFMQSATASGFDRLGTIDSEARGSLLRSQSTLYLEHTSASRMTNRFQVYYKFQETDSQSLDSLELSHRLQYQTRWWRVSLEHFYVIGDDSDYTVARSAIVGSTLETSALKEQFIQRGLVEYRPNNYWLGRVETDVTWGKDYSGDKSTRYKVRQKVERTFYSMSNVRRKRGDVSQSLILEQVQERISRRAMIFSLAGNYYPTTYWRLGAGAHYYDYDYRDNHYSLTLTTGLDFPLFKLDFSYMYAAAEANDTVAHRYEVNVKKTF